MATTILCSIGSRSADNVTVSSVSGSDPGPYTVTLNAAVPATTKIGDTLTDSGARKYLIENISGSDLTVYKRHFAAGADPATGAGTTQRAYTMPHLWEAAAPASLVTADQIWKGEMWNDATFTINASSMDTSFSSAGDDTRYYHLTAAAGQSYVDHANRLTNELYPDQANGVLINVTDGWASGGHSFWAATISTKVIVERIQILDVRTASWPGAIWLDCTGIMRNLIIKCKGSNTANGSTTYIRTGYMANTALIITGAQGNALGSLSGLQVNLSGVSALNSSGSSAVAAFTGSSSSIICIGCTAFLFGADNSQLSASSSNNATDRASFGAGTSNQVSLTTTEEIESATSGSEDLRAKADSNLKNNGIADATYTGGLDIVGQTRNATTPTIGCWEIVAGGAVAEGGGMLLGSRRNRLTIP